MTYAKLKRYVEEQDWEILALTNEVVLLKKRLTQNQDQLEEARAIMKSQEEKQAEVDKKVSVLQTTMEPITGGRDEVF